MGYFGAALSDAGTSKRTNQDAVLLKIVRRPRDGAEYALVAVCDGMGGLANGELAATTAIRAIESWFEEVFLPAAEAYGESDFIDDWQRLTVAINQAIMRYGRERGIELGTTLTLILLLGGRYMLTHVGDSRVYAIDDTGDIEQLTEDHTLVAREIKRGNLTPEQAAIDARRNVLLQCVGASQKVIPQFRFGEISPGSVIMVCSDGLRHKNGEADFREHLRPAHNHSAADLEDRLRYLIDRAKDLRERDNISAAAVKYTAEEA